MDNALGRCSHTGDAGGGAGRLQAHICLNLVELGALYSV